jgi:hypothetical protein
MGKVDGRLDQDMVLALDYDKHELRSATWGYAERNAGFNEHGSKARIQKV